MNFARTARRRLATALVLVVATSLSLAHALEAPRTSRRFDALALPDPSVSVSPAIVTAAAPLPGSIQAGWSAFKSAHGVDWDVYIDARSGAPLLVQGQGVPFIAGGGNALQPAGPTTLESLATSLRDFMAKNTAILLAEHAELVLSEKGSAQLAPDLWKVVFERSVAGVPVQGDRYIFYIGHGNLIAFGATRWTPIATDPTPSIPSAEAEVFLYNYMGLTDSDTVDLFDRGSLTFVPTTAVGTGPDSFDAAIGTGYDAALAWRIVLAIEGEPGRWVGLVDAHTGAVLALYDDVKYAQVKGGVLPLTNDSICPGGCEQANFAMPYADITIGAGVSYAGSLGAFTCAPGGSTATTTLNGPYVRVVDTCGDIVQTVTCNADMNLKTSGGTDCTVPVGASTGDTRAARSTYYHLNRAAEHVRWWLPSNTWVRSQVTDTVNENNTCNAYWDGVGVNFFKSGGGCRNTGENAAVVLHEWGHGLDQNDGGGYDYPYEAYADVTSFMQTHTSCIGRGFQGSACGGYGNACVTCTGVRDQDWNQRVNHVPSTPENFLGYCPSGDSPCGGESHCEAYVVGEAMWDFAARDLPAAGIDQQAAWQIADRLWFQSRPGSGGNAYGCGSPVANRSCSAGSWFTELRTLDDDDGNLANGTPHAAAIFAAFNRHNIPCGGAADAANQNHSSCPALVASTPTVTATTSSVALSWAPVAGASSYNVLRNDQGCGWAFTVVANVAGTSYVDADLPYKATLYYAIQPVGSNSACTGSVSACATVQTTGPHVSYAANTRVADNCFSGGVGDNDGFYDAGERAQFSVSIKNDGDRALTGVTATIASSTPGVTILDPTASYDNIPVGVTATSLAPHFTSLLAPDLVCGATAAYTLTINANEGSWTDYLSQIVGHPTGGSRTAFSEDFSGGIPVTWTIVNGGSGGGAAATWTTANPCSRTFNAPIVAPAAIVDSNCAGPSATQDEQLITPTLNLSTAATATLSFDTYFNWASGGLAERGEVDVASSRTSGAWFTVIRYQNGATSNPEHRTLNIASVAAGASDVRIRFHYYNASNENYWVVDNVVVTIDGAGPCLMNTCPSCAGVPAEVDNGVRVSLTTRTAARITWSLPLLAGRSDILRGLVSALPVGPGGGDETCLGNDVPGPAITDADLPPAGSSFWYLVRAVNGCGAGPYGAQVGAAGQTTPRESATCQ